jgi:hypothetical protein
MRRPRYLIAAIAAVIGVPAFLLAGGPTTIMEAYPYDHAKREALARCEAGDTHFVRFLASDRNACYLGVHLAGYSPTSAN